MLDKEKNQAGMTQLQRLKSLKVSEALNNLTRFDNLIGIDVGVEPREHFPKLKDSNGKTVKDEKGRDVRSEILDGYTYTFAEYGTAKVIKVVLSKQVNVGFGKAYSLSGSGYDIKQGNMYFLEKDTSINLF